jgi:hypothetical protein
MSRSGTQTTAGKTNNPSLVPRLLNDMGVVLELRREFDPVAGRGRAPRAERKGQGAKGRGQGGVTPRRKLSALTPVPSFVPWVEEE